MATNDKNVAYESDVHKLVLDNQTLFGTLGNSRVIMEKKLPQRKVIADMLIFSAYKGIIGIEIKTAHDSTQRLNNQLKAYKRLCNQVWVVIADEQYEDVLKVLKRYHHDCVGIITYSQLKDKLYPGVMRRPHQPPEFDPKEAFRMLWKDELLVIARGVSSTDQILANVERGMNNLNQLGYSKHYTYKPKNIGNGKGAKIGNVAFQRQLGMSNEKNTAGDDSIPFIPLKKSNSKEQIISYIFHKLSPLGAHQLLVDMFVNKIKAPNKVLKYYHFSEAKRNHYEVTKYQ